MSYADAGILAYSNVVQTIKFILNPGQLGDVMSRTALFANAFNDLIKKARREADQQKAVIAKELEQAKAQYDKAQEKVAELEKQLAEIDDELAIGLVAAARESGIKIDLKRASAAVSPPPAPSESKRKSPSDTTRERNAVLAMLKKHRGTWLASTEIKETTGVGRPVSILLKNETGIESQGKGRGVQYRIL